MSIPDAYAQWAAHDLEKERWLERRPVCSNCRTPIQDEEAYLINDEVICQECLNSDFKINVEDCIDAD